MTKKKNQLLKAFFTEGVLGYAKHATTRHLKVEYAALARQWKWLTEHEQWQAEAYAKVLKKRGETQFVKKFQNLYIAA